MEYCVVIHKAVGAAVAGEAKAAAFFFPFGNGVTKVF